MISILLLLACANPADYGGIPNDSISDRVAIQAAIDSGRSVCIGPGRWRVDRAPIGSYNRFAALSTHGKGIDVKGSGPATVIELVGDQGAGTVAVISIDPGSEDVKISDLAIDTRGAYNTDEQTHAIQIGSSTCSGAACSPVERVSIDRVMFAHPRGQDGSRKGDCIRILGNTPGTRVVGVQVIGGMFLNCARSGVSIQRNVHHVMIRASLFRESGDQDIDSEPTGGAGDANSNISIVGNLFSDTTRISQGDHAVSVGGISTPMSNVIVSGNIFDGRGLRLYRVEDVAITGNVFDAVMLGTTGVINSSNVLNRAVISSNVISRSGYNGPIVRVTPQSGGVPGSVSVTANNMTNNTNGTGVYMESVRRADVHDNAITWSIAAHLQSAIYLRATGGDIEGIAIVGNRISAVDLGWAVLLSASPYSIGMSLVNANLAIGTRVGVACLETSPGVVLGVVSDGNAIGPRQCSRIVEGD